MVAYQDLLEAEVPTRQAAALLGLSRTTNYRTPIPPTEYLPTPPPNNLSTTERSEILTVLNSP